MQKLVLHISIIVFFITSCSNEKVNDSPEYEGTILKVFSRSLFNPYLIDEDNLAVEQIINNLSIFFTEPSSNDFVYKYIHTGFTLSGEYQIITLPLELTDLQSKDIYVVANYDDENTLEAQNTLDNLKGLITPVVDKTNNLNPANGFCMYGSLANFDFVTSDEPATIGLERTCAKLRVNLTFPETPTLSTNNSFLIQHAASYTFVIKNPTAVLPLSEYFNFAAALPLTDNGSQVYTNNAYVYEASDHVVITVYTHLNNSMEQQEFTTSLPIPERNYLYDLNIQIYEEEDVARSKSPGYKFVSTVAIYNEKGELIK